VPAPADHPAYPEALDVAASGLDWSISMHGLPAVGLSCEDRSWVAGPGRPVARVSGSCHHLYRSLTGRRTPAQIAALDWSAGPLAPRRPPPGPDPRAGRGPRPGAGAAGVRRGPLQRAARAARAGPRRVARPFP